MIEQLKPFGWSQKQNNSQGMSFVRGYEYLELLVPSDLESLLNLKWQVFYCQNRSRQYLGCLNQGELLRHEFIQESQTTAKT